MRLRPGTVGPDASEDRFLDALWREAMRQSVALDIAGGAEMARGGPEIALHHDEASATLASTLHLPGEAPRGLASAHGEMTEAIDALALATRQALGERVARQPVPATKVYSADRDCVLWTERGNTANQAGEWVRAQEHLRRARVHDPGCTITLAALAKTLLNLGISRGKNDSIDEAQRIAVEGLALGERLGPTTKHRLAHTALVAQAQGRGRVPDRDRELLTLGDVAARERPHDPHPRHTRAVALNFLGRYTESAPLLRALARRWPHSGEVAYHLAFAELATGDPEASLAAIRAAAARLPRSHAVVVPTALALFHCGRHDELRRYLEGQTADPVYRKSAGLHELRRMQTAHALLTDRTDDAVQLLLADLEWMRQRPSRLDYLALDLAEAGEVLVRIGRHRDLRAPLRAFEALRDLPPTTSSVMVYLGGLVEVAETNQRAEAVEAHLRSAGQGVWSGKVRAAAHLRRGELTDELRERMIEYQTTDDPLSRASLARALEAAGSHDHAAEVLEELRGQLFAYDLRRLHDHPLMRPAGALAYLATQQLGGR